MKIENILEAAKRWNPVKILTQPDEEYVTLKEGEVVIDFNDELMMSYDGKGTWQISYGDWIGDYENPMPVIDLIMSGFMKIEHDEEDNVKLTLVDEHNKINDCVEAVRLDAEQSCLKRMFEAGINPGQA